MTHAVCVLCGAMKWGAWTACEGCSGTPHGEEQLAWSMILSDHYLDAENLDAASLIIRETGRMPTIDDAVIDDTRAFVRGKARHFRKLGLLPPEQAG